MMGRGTRLLHVAEWKSSTVTIGRYIEKSEGVNMHFDYSWEEKEGEQKMEAKESNVRVDRKKWELVELRGVIKEFVRKKGREENTFISKVGIYTATWDSPQK